MSIVLLLIDEMGGFRQIWNEFQRKGIQKKLFNL